VSLETEDQYRESECPRETSGRKGHTLVADLEDGPENFVFLLSLMRSILGIFHLIAELEQSIFDIVEAGRRRFAISGCANGRHDEVVRYVNEKTGRKQAMIQRR